MAEITNEDIIRRIEQTERLMEEVQQLGYERTNELGAKIERVASDTKDMVAAFNAAQGAFKVLEWIAKIAKPLMVITSTIGAAYLWSKGYRG